MSTPNSGSFLSDIKTLRERARRHIEQGAITDSYKADLPTVLKLLNEALATELVCVLRYKRH
jgi:bacterioferritin